jgi:glucose-6-phosphate 1-dehydrogenase
MFIDHVQIDVRETLALGKRSAFYESTGAHRDIVVTHLFQIVAFTAMEPPTSLEPGPKTASTPSPTPKPSCHSE